MGRGEARSSSKSSESNKGPEEGVVVVTVVVVVAVVDVVVEPGKNNGVKRVVGGCRRPPAVQDRERRLEQQGGVGSRSGLRQPHSGLSPNVLRRTARAPATGRQMPLCHPRDDL